MKPAKVVGAASASIDKTLKAKLFSTLAAHRRPHCRRVPTSMSSCITIIPALEQVIRAHEIHPSSTRQPRHYSVYEVHPFSALHCEQRGSSKIDIERSSKDVATPGGTSPLRRFETSCLHSKPDSAEIVYLGPRCIEFRPPFADRSLLIGTHISSVAKYTDRF